MPVDPPEPPPVSEPIRAEDPVPGWYVVDEHAGAPAYARFAGQRHRSHSSQKVQAIISERIGPPQMARSRLSRVMSRPSHSGYRDNTGQMSRFTHLG